MNKEKRKEEEEDEETRSEEREAESTLGGIEAYSKELERQLKIVAERQEGPETAKAELTEDEEDMILSLACKGYSSNTIMEIMGVDDGVIDRLAVEEFMRESEFGMIRIRQAKEGLKVLEDYDRVKSQDDDEYFEEYDPVKWQTANEEENVDKARDEKDVPELHLPHTDEVIPETSGILTSPNIQDSKDFEKEYEQKLQLKFPLEPEFVRALKDSKMGTKPYFRKGHILRVINKARRGKLGDAYFELLPLKPPGEAGKALIQHFEPADQAAADEVGREARNDKELDSFRCAMDWED